MAQPTEPDHATTIQNFHRKLDECTRTAVCGRPYVLVEKLQQWLRSPVPQSKTTQVARLLHAAYRHRTTPGLPVNLSAFKPGGDCCLLIFSALLAIDRGQMLDQVVEHEKSDFDLPLHWETVNEIFGSEQQAQGFFDVQWRFCPYKFGLQKPAILKKPKVVPICRMDPIKEGGTAHLFRIAILEEFVLPDLRKAMSSSRFVASRDSHGNLEWGHEFALKTFKEGHIRVFKNEIDALRGLKDNDGMVRWLGNFTQEETRRRSQPAATEANQILEGSGITTHNILLEFGEEDLEVLFGNRLPPVLHDEIKEFWTSLFDVADAVKAIHHLKIVVNGLLEEFYGWHSDIKPDNILRVTDEFNKDQYKLADPGFAGFQRIQKTQNKQPPRMLVPGVTETYGPPECYLGKGEDPTPVLQTIDIWSLGCVFSEAATWVALGHSGIWQFSQVRETEIEGIVESRPRICPEQAPRLAYGDYFHNGRDILPIVKDWHEYLRTILRATDTITARVLDLIDQRMLLGSADDRISAEDLCKELEKIFQQSDERPNQEPPRRQISESLKRALLNVEESASPKAAEKTSPETAPGHVPHQAVKRSSEVRKSKLKVRPKEVTSHRKSVLSTSLLDSNLPEVAVESPKGSKVSGTLQVPWQVDGPARTKQSGSLSFTQRSVVPDQPEPSDTHSHEPRPKIERAKTPRTHTPQNVFQAREEIRERERHNILNRTRKDPLLEQHYHDRDIVSPP